MTGHFQHCRNPTFTVETKLAGIGARGNKNPTADVREAQNEASWEWVSARPRL
jgi:hypothetical protein